MKRAIATAVILAVSFGSLQAAEEQDVPAQGGGAEAFPSGRRTPQAEASTQRVVAAAPSEVTVPRKATVPVAPDPGQPPTSAESTQRPPSIAEIIVTARRVEERLQDVPISITVLNQEQLSTRNISTGADLAAFTPSLTASQRYGADTVSFAIRGFTQEQRTAASVAVYFADVVAPRGGGINTTGGDGTGPGAYFDLQNVQVLKGPQGTLFGRNTTGGAVLLVPNKPTSEWEGYSEVSLGNFDMRRLQGVLNAPLSERVRMRFGVDRQTRDGYAKNISGVGPSRYSDVDYITGRISLVADIMPDLENYTVASYTKTDTNGSIPQVFACDTTRAYGAAACAQIARNTKNDFYAVQSSLPDAGFKSDTWQIINTTTWHTTDFLTVKNIASYGQYEDTIRVPLFGEDFLSSSALPAGLANRSYTFATAYSPEAFSSNDQKSWTEELQFQGRSGDSRLVWQAGGYIERSEPASPSGNFSYSNLNCADPANVQCQNVLGAARLLAQPSSLTAAVLTGSLNRSVGTMAFQNWAAYAQASYDVTAKVVLTGGIRYTSDTTRGTAQKYALYYDPQLPAALNSGNPIAALCTVGPLDTAPTAARLNSLDACRISLQQNSDAPTWTIGVDYKPVEDLMLYTKYSRGYRQGSVNPFGPLGFNRFAEEKVDAYEAGMKFTFGGAHPGTFNIAGLYNDLSDQQLLIATVGGPGGATPGIVNAGKSRIWGTELESSIELFTNFRVDLSYAYLNTELVQAVLPTLPAGSLSSSIARSFDIGEPLPLTPDHKLSLAGRYALPLPERVGTVSAGAIYSYTSPYSTSSISSAGKQFYRVAETNLVTMNLNWESIAGSTFDASFFVTNLLDEEYTPYLQAGINSLGFQSRVLGQPRMYGMRVRFRFGE